MQPRALRISLLLTAGVIIAAVVTFVLGWFAAIAIPIQTVRTISQSPVAAFIVFSFAMNILPALAIGFLAGAALGARSQTSRLQLVALASLPWLVYATLGPGLFLPSLPEVGITQSLALLQSWQVWLPVVSVPVGLWLGTTLFTHKPPENAAAAASAA